MLRMCVYMHSRFVENHPIQIMEDGPLISKGVLSHAQKMGYNGCINLDRDAQREIKTYFILIQVGHFY
jgi:hypothetical protein